MAKDQPKILKVTSVGTQDIYLNIETGKFTIGMYSEPTFGLLEFAVAVAKNRDRVERKVHKVSVRFFHTASGKHGTLLGYKDGQRYGEKIIKWDNDDKPTTEKHFPTSNCIKPLFRYETIEYNGLVLALKLARERLDAFKKAREFDLEDEVDKQIEANREKYKNETY